MFFSVEAAADEALAILSFANPFIIKVAGAFGAGNDDLHTGPIGAAGDGRSDDITISDSYSRFKRCWWTISQ